MTIQDVMALWKPEWDSESDMDIAFKEACALARAVISKALAHAKADIEEKAFVRSVYELSPEKDVLVFSKQVSSLNLVEYPEVLAMVCPNEEGNWNGVMVRETYDSFKTRKQFPETWAGLRDQELAAVSGIPDAVFCHKARFFFVAKSKESALEAVKKALSQ